MLGWILLIIILALLAFALYSFYMQGEPIDDREVWWLPGRESGPFYWRKRWMGKARALRDGKVDPKEIDKAIESTQKAHDKVIRDNCGHKVPKGTKCDWEIERTNDQVKRGLEDIIAGKVISYEDLKGNIRVKQKQDDWDDIETMYYVRQIHITEDNRGSIRVMIKNLNNEIIADYASGVDVDELNSIIKRLEDA